MSTVSLDRIEGRIARVLSIGAVIAVVLLVVGIGLMVASGIEPDRAVFPVFDPARLVGDLVTLRPEGFLWAGILVVIATPVIRVIGELVGFAIRGDRTMAAVAAAILVIVTASVAVAVILEG
ncbi:MAG: DUF1634 domain-containing protein [Candidatus Limnocylindrales bacterium]